jgi:hypothetical protein
MNISAWLPLQTCRILLLLTVALFCGCKEGAKRFVPAPNVARQALVDALDAWKSGQPSGAVANTAPQVHVTDNLRKAQQRLIAYTILGEKASRSGRTFMVELSMESPVEKLKAEYIIVGIDPLWVFRREDYELLMHWDHHMPESPEAPERSSESSKP